MKTRITIENGRITIEHEDEAPIVVNKPTKPVVITPPEPEQPARQLPNNGNPASREPSCGYCRKRGEPCVRHGGDDSQNYAGKADARKERQRKYNARYRAKQKAKKAAGGGDNVEWCKHCEAYTTHSTANHPGVEVPAAQKVDKPVHLPEPGPKHFITELRSICCEAKVDDHIKPNGKKTYSCRGCGKQCMAREKKIDTSSKSKPPTPSNYSAKPKSEFMPGHEKSQDEIESWRPKVTVPEPLGGSK